MAKPAYHHGDLRRALLDAGLAVVEREGVEGLGLRAVAREAGVSHAAPYHHFADKAALVEAMAVRGFADLVADMTRALQRPGTDELTGLYETGRAYARFALGHEELFRLMNRPELRRDSPAVVAAAQAAYDVLVAAVAAGQRAGVVDGTDPRPVARTAWSAVHGVVVLLIDGLLADGPGGPVEAERVVDDVLVLVGTGFVTPPPR